MTTASTKIPTPRDVARKAVPLRRKLAAITPDDPAPIPAATCLMDVTPALAAGWLLRNTRNRGVRAKAVAAMVRDMTTGKWKFIGGTISFDSDGALVDGQHRLLAVIQSETTQQFVIVPGLDTDAMGVVDTGAKRTAADAFNLQGIAGSPPATIAAAVARLGVLVEAGALTANTMQLTNAEILEWLNAHSDAYEYVRRAVSLRRHYDVPPAIIAYCMWRLAQVDVFEAGRFFDDWKDLRTQGVGDPVAALIQRFRTAKSSNERLTRAAQIGMIFRAWNARRSGATLQRMQAVGARGRIDIPEPK